VIKIKRCLNDRRQYICNKKNKKGKTSEIEGIFLYENNYNRRDEILLKGS